MDPRNLPGSLKAAILIQSLDREISQEIFNSLDEKERELLKTNLSQMGTVSPELAEKIASEFTGMLGQGGASKGHPSASDPGAPILKALQSLEPERLSELVKHEHPQTIAIVLAHLDTGVASKALAKLPDEIKSDVAIRIAGMDKVGTGMVEEIDKIFESVLKNKQSSMVRKTGGVNRLAQLIKRLDGTSGELILNEIEETDPDLAEEIKKRLFVFEDILLVDDKGLQKVLRAVDTNDVAMSLKAASEEIIEKVLRNLSERAGEMLQEEMENLGAVRMKEVQDSQQTIIRVIQDMEQKGDIIISGRGGEEFIE